MSVPEHGRPRAVIFGCAGLSLDEWERRFFRDSDPLGFILFARNIAAPDQVRQLVGALRDSIGRADAPVLIDQEGGRVARLRPPHWRTTQPAARFGRLDADDSAAAEDACRLNARLIADELSQLGITVDCAPVVDIPVPGASDVIGDRAYGHEVARVVRLARATAEGLLDGGVLPVIKHIPGHGRAYSDSHKELPRVDAPRAELERTDFAAFKALSDLPFAMTAHVLFSAIDPRRAATVSPSVVNDVIRSYIGFSGVLFSDDLSMEALGGDMRRRTHDALAAGCDVVLHCNGVRDEMRRVADGAGGLSERTLRGLADAEALRRRRAQPFGADARHAATARLDGLLATG